MWRASAVAVAAAATIGLMAGGLRADDVVAQREKARLEGQLADEAAAITQALTSVTDKLTAAETVRTNRLRAAYRLLRAPLRSNANAADRMAAARRRAGARLLVQRDTQERALLVEEAGRLRAASLRTSNDAKGMAMLSLPESLMPPVNGDIARRFGTLLHERSRATLSRRGLDYDVELRADVVAPAAGTVRYAGPIRGLDRGVIIDHGDYYTVIAKLGELAVPVGAPVHQGDRIGRAERRRVYVEVRVQIGPGGLPIDPEPLFREHKRVTK
ncbi:MAG: murein hydrolase activator EnvC [Kofleriaceae bacterium]